MRAFKQFLSLVLVTCMLTSMVTLVSADYAFTTEQKWDSDSGRITMVQDTGTPVNSNYTRVQDSGVDAVLEGVGIDLSNEKDVTVTITGEKIADSGYTLKVCDETESPIYTSDVVNRKANLPDEQSSDKWKITFHVSPAIIAAGTKLEVYRGEYTEPGWKIQYTVDAMEITGDHPVEIPPVIDKTGASTIPAATVNAVLEALEKEATSATVTVTKDENAKSLLLDADVFENAKFQSGFELNIQVTDKDKVYTWIFTSESAQKAVSRMDNTDGSTVDLGVAMEEKNDLGKNGDISGTAVTLQSANVPEGKTAQLKVGTERKDSVNVYYKAHDGKWGAIEENNGLSVAADGTVTFEVVSGMTSYAIVDSSVMLKDMNGEDTPATEHEYTVEIAPTSATVEVEKTATFTATVKDSGKPITTENYEIQWAQTSGEGEVTIQTVDSNVASVTGKTAGEVTVTATLVSVDGETVEGTVAASVTVTVTEKGTEPDPLYAITVTPDKATIKVGETTTLKAVVTEDGKTLSDAAVTWTTSDSKVATVNNGTVTAVAKGTADITASYAYADGKSCTAKAVITVTEDEVPEITIKLDPTVRFVYIGRAPVTLTATVTGTDEKAVFTTEDNGLIRLTDNGDNTATVKGLKAGDTTVTATVGGKTATCKILVRVYHGGGSGGGSSSSGGGGSWNDGSHGSSMPSAGSGTTTTPGTGTTTPGTGTSGNAQPQGCVSDTVGNFSVKGSYQYKLTSTNGQAPAVTVSNSNFRVVLASQNGKDYFFKVYAVGAVGQTCDVLVNGTKVSTVTASEVYGGVACDTTAPFTVKKGGSYQFKLTASSKPVMAAGSSSFRVEYVGNSGNDWFFKVYAVGNAGDGCGFYVNGAPFTVAVAHIGE